MDTTSRLERHGLGQVASAQWNLGAEALYEAAVAAGDGHIGAGGALLCETGQHTGRSPKDKFIVRNSPVSYTHLTLPTIYSV